MHGGPAGANTHEHSHEKRCSERTMSLSSGTFQRTLLEAQLSVQLMMQA